MNEVNENNVREFFDQTLGHLTDAGRIAGAAVSVVKDDSLIFSRGYGFADREQRLEVDADTTLFRVASMSKLITWTALMQLVESGTLSLDDDVNDHLDSFQIPATFAEPVRIRNLLTHTAGFETNKFGYYLAPDAAHLRPLAESLARHMPARVRPPATDFTDGRLASYSDWGAALAGHIVAVKAGRSFEDYVDERIFRPCGMLHSTFRETPRPERVAVGYEYRNFALEPRGFEYLSPIGPAASLSTSASDMAKFMLAQLRLGDCDHGQRILRAETAQLMQSRQLSPRPELNGFGYGFFETWVNGLRTIGHAGKSVYFHSELMLIPEKGIGLFIACNTVPPDSGLPEAFVRRFFPAELPRLSPPADFSRRARQFEGVYASTRRSYGRSEALFGFLIDAEEVRATNNNTLSYKGVQWVEVRPDVFRWIDGGETIAFVRDETRQVRHLLGPVAVYPRYKLGAHETGMFYATSLVGTVQQVLHPARGASRVGWMLFAVLVVLLATATGLTSAGNPQPAASWFVFGAGLADVLILAALVLTAADLQFAFQRLLERIPWYLRATSWLSMLSLVFTIMAGGCAVRAWSLALGSVYERLGLTTLVILAVACLGWLHRWNLLGFRHGVGRFKPKAEPTLRALTDDARTSVPPA
ncbi:MAG: serine hydrolase domain-containing protein [Panacagrimonas sp.]